MIALNDLWIRNKYLVFGPPIIHKNAVVHTNQGIYSSAKDKEFNQYPPDIGRKMNVHCT